MLNISDVFFQPLDFLLATMADTSKAPSSKGINLLLQLTEDRGDLMTSFREKYFASGAGLGEEYKQYLFELTNLFAKMVYHIHEWTESWRTWARSTQHACSSLKEI